ncbi:MAG: hypothetical protein ACRELX_14800 [Longimicrobiales bacterium]
MRPPRFAPHDEERMLTLVRTHVDDLLGAWWSLKDDARRGRLERNVLVD